MLRALEDPPRRTQADIARETGRSPAYVSILCRIGDAIRELPADDQARLCQPHVTYTVLAALVARHKHPDVLRAALQAFAARPPRTRAALRGASLWGSAAGPAPSDDPLDPIPEAGPAGGGAPVGRMARSDPAVGARGTRTYGYAFDPADWRRDAEAAFAAFAAHVQALCEGVLRDAIRAVGADAGALRRLPAPPSTSAAPGAPAAGAFVQLSVQERAARFAGLELSLRQLEAGALATLRGHHARLAAFEAERALLREGRAGAARVPPPGGAPGGATPEAAPRASVADGGADDASSGVVTPDDVEADLAD